jgi:hypothetical protein
VELCLELEFVLILLIVIFSIFEYKHTRAILCKVYEIKGELMYKANNTLRQIVINAKLKEKELLQQELQEKKNEK